MSRRQPSILRQLYKDSLVARKVFDYWANRKQHREESLLSRTAREAGVEEEEVKELFRSLDQHSFGRYIKRSRGGQARFRWGTEGDENQSPCDYSLISVARVAQGHDESLDGYYDNPEGGLDDEDDIDEPAQSRSGASTQLMSLKFKFRGIPSRIDLPIDFDPDQEMENLTSLISVLVKNERC